MDNETQLTVDVNAGIAKRRNNGSRPTRKNYDETREAKWVSVARFAIYDRDSSVGQCACKITRLCLY